MGSGRDLLQKPQIPATLPEDASGAKKVDKGKAGAAPTVERTATGTGQGAPPVAKGSPPPGRAAAYKAAYFNADSSGVREVNQRASNMQALRGGEGASDLKRVVLPPAAGISEPDPSILREAANLMGIDGRLDATLESFLGRHGQWARGDGVTLEMLEARMAELEAMVAIRKQALARMRNGAAAAVGRSATVGHAIDAEGEALDRVDDLAVEGRALIDRVTQQAEGMHRRLAKMLGIKKPG